MLACVLVSSTVQSIASEFVYLDVGNDSEIQPQGMYNTRSSPSHRNKSKPGDFLSVHYNGTLYSDGRDFDSSILRCDFV
jgi:FKBP-type peptidyl-prolyl cis-trans isomerase